MYVAFGLIAYLAGMIAFVGLIAFLGNWHPGVSIDAGAGAAVSVALVVNTGLVCGWWLQHIGMARRPFKRLAFRELPHPLERSTYVLCTAIATLMLIVFWVPMPQPVYEVATPAARLGVSLLFWAGWVFALCGIFYDSHFEFMGLKQAFAGQQRRAFSPSAFKTGFVFRLCRRPSFFGILLATWATPDMTLGRLHFASATTAFVLLGAYFVERSYVSQYGNAYREYQRRIPLLLPKLWGHG